MENKDLARYGIVFGAGVLTTVLVASITTWSTTNVLVSTPPVSESQELSSHGSPGETESSDASNSGGIESLESENSISSKAGAVESSTVGQEKDNRSGGANQNKGHGNGNSTEISAGKPSAGVTDIQDLIRGSQVTIRGTVIQVREEDEFVVRDATGSVQVYTGRTHWTVSEGQEVTVKGFVDDEGYLEIYADQISLPDGSTISVRHWR